MCETTHTEDDRDIEQVVMEYGGSIVKYCYNLLWDYHEAQDAAQDVFLTAVQRLSDLRDGSSLSTWLYRVAHNTCMDILRRKKRAKLVMLRESAKNGINVYDDCYDIGISRELQAALNTLSLRDRALVYSRAVDEMEYSQLEEIYGVKAATLRKRYERARKKLEAELEKGGFDNV